MQPLRKHLATAALLMLFGGGAIIGLRAWADARHAPGALESLGSPAACRQYSGLPAGFGHETRAGMVKVPGGSFVPGNPDGYPDERPGSAAQVRMAAFWIDRTEVTNAQFTAFVEATGYRTVAERDGGAAVFRAPDGKGPVAPMSWWVFVEGAHWRQPEGPGSGLKGRHNHPVVQVSREDALAYARWLGHDLPTEDEWEWAARAGGDGEKLDRQPRDPGGKPTANFWQGLFPVVNIAEDGHVDRAPAGCYPASGWALHDMIGNVWEWTQDPYRSTRQARAASDTARELRAAGGTPPAGTPYVIKGGSFLCAADYCRRYRSTARHAMEENLPTSHVGFRTVLR